MEQQQRMPDPTLCTVSDDIPLPPESELRLTQWYTTSRIQNRTENQPSVQQRFSRGGLDRLVVMEKGCVLPECLPHARHVRTD